jgi:hypothetical protein
LKALAGTSWGQCKETLLLTYKLLIRPLIDYKCAVWYPNISATSIKKLQTIQNAAICIIAGCHLMTNVKHLHTEVKELMVKDHLELLSTQYLASTLHQTHPSHTTVTLPPGPRQKETLYSKCIEQVQPHLTNGKILEVNYKKTISSLHSDAVAKAICTAGPNKVLD